MNDNIIEVQKQQRLEKFLREHPDWNSISDSQIEMQIRKQKRLAKRLERVKEMSELKCKNRLTLEQIGLIYGLTRERIRQIISKIIDP